MEAQTVHITQKKELRKIAYRSEKSCDWFDHFRAQDPEGFKEMYRLYFPALSFYASMVVGPNGDAQLLANDALLIAWKHNEKISFTAKVNLERFLYRVCKNGCISHLRKSNVRQKALKELTYLSLVEEEAIDLKKIHAELIAQLYRQIDCLPEKSREIIQLSFLEGKKRSEIAQLLKMDEKEVSLKKFRALAALRKCLSPFVQGCRTLILCVIFSHF